MTITYRDNNLHTRVYLDKKHVGDILQRLTGKWFYQPRAGGKAAAGDDMANRNAVKRSLEPAGDEATA
jgi:hypothetical protein